MTAKQKLIVALDTDDLKKAEDLVDTLSGVVEIFKVGSVLFTAHGFKAVEMVQGKDCEVFLDLKFHDIPYTVGKASRLVARHNVFMFNLHASGGRAMIVAAVSGAREESERLNLRRPLMLGVTVLTSIDENAWRDLGVDRDIKSQVIHLAQLSRQAGLDGVVASPRDAADIRAGLNPGEDFIILSPGIRPVGANISGDDQKRFMTPKEAVERGCSYIVLGRPITAAEDPRRAAEKIIAEME